jgi:DNA-binding MarR family transcriptional regulator
MCLHAQRAARALARRYDEALKPAGTTSGQFSLLMSLNRPEPPRMGAVAALLAMDHTTLTANLKPLRRRGLVTVDADPADRRGKLLSLTEQGTAVLQEAMPVWLRTQAEVEALVAGTGADAVRADMRALSDQYAPSTAFGGPPPP